DGIRDDLVTGVQTCALPISALKAKLLPLATVVTPDVAEAAALSAVPRERMEGIPAAKEVARQILGLGARAVVIKRVAFTDEQTVDRKSTRLNSSHQIISYAV